MDNLLNTLADTIRIIETINHFPNITLREILTELNIHYDTLLPILRKLKSNRIISDFSTNPEIKLTLPYHSISLYDLITTLHTPAKDFNSLLRNELYSIMTKPFTRIYICDILHNIDRYIERKVYKGM